MHHLTYITQEALILVLVASAPPIILSLIVGFFVSVFQATTQIQEQTLSFVVKLVAVVLTLMIMGGWLGGQIMSFSSAIFSNFAIWSMGG